MRDITDLMYPFVEPAGGDIEAHLEPSDQGVKSNVVDYDHPMFSSTGMINMINLARSLANSDEKPLSGEIPAKVFEDLATAARKTKFPYDLLVFVCDWEKDMTTRSDASDAEGFAKKMLQSLPQLRSALGRDPLNAELFAAHVLGSAQKVKQIYEDNVNKPEEEVKSPGSSKDDVLINKKRGTKTQKRTNRELYDFFYKRVPVGKILFKQDLGKDVNA